MASIKPYKNGYRVWTYDQNDKPKTKTFAKKSEANQWAAEMELARKSKQTGKYPENSFGTAVKKYLTEIVPTHAGAKWETLRLNKILRECEFSTFMLTDITPQMLTQWRENRLKEVQPPSVRREMTLIGGVFEAARRDWFWIKDNPLNQVRKPAHNPRRKNRMSDEQVNKICQALGYYEPSPITTKKQETAVALMLAIETGMRTGELLNIEWKYVYLTKRYVHLPKTKNGDERDVPLSSRALSLIEKMKGRHKAKVFTVSESSKDTIFRTARDLANLKHLNFHDSRHEALTRLSKKLDVLELARMVGHNDLNSLLIYYEADAEEMAGKLD